MIHHAIHLRLLPAAVLCACNAASFDPPSKIESVRVLAIAADRPYAKPGDTVALRALAFDGRSSKAQGMGLWWLPQACVNPSGDAYYACYPAFGGAFRPGVDLTGQLTSGESFTFQVPDDAITSHSGNRGGAPYGVVAAFAVACAGHVEYAPPAAGAPADSLPIGCFDAQNVRLGANDFVFAYALVYVFAARSNANPVIDHLTFGGQPVDPTAGITLSHCTRSNIDDCPTTPLDTILPASSQEPDPSDLDANGKVLGEEVWVDYYVTGGKVKNDTVVLFDPRDGRLSGTADDFHAPQASGDYALWSVVHDNRGGVSWIQVALHAQ